MRALCVRRGRDEEEREISEELDYTPFHELVTAEEPMPTQSNGPYNTNHITPSRFLVLPNLPSLQRPIRPHAAITECSADTVQA
jgi:hypothetical protein